MVLGVGDAFDAEDRWIAVESIGKHHVWGRWRVARNNLFDPNLALGTFPKGDHSDFGWVYNYDGRILRFLERYPTDGDRAKIKVAAILYEARLIHNVGFAPNAIVTGVGGGTVAIPSKILKDGEITWKRP
jgi:hypothetical protein